MEAESGWRVQRGKGSRFHFQVLLQPAQGVEVEPNPLPRELSIPAAGFSLRMTMRRTANFSKRLLLQWELIPVLAQSGEEALRMIKELCVREANVLRDDPGPKRCLGSEALS